MKKEMQLKKVLKLIFLLVIILFVLAINLETGIAADTTQQDLTKIWKNSDLEQQKKIWSDIIASPDTQIEIWDSLKTQDGKHDNEGKE